MTSLLLLLSLLSVATLATRRGAFGEIVSGAATPILVVVGVAVSTQGLGFVTPSMVESFASGTQVAMCWLGVVAGFRIAARGSQARLDSRALIPLLDGALAFGVLLAAHVLGQMPLAAPLPVLALVAGACLGAPASTGLHGGVAKGLAVACAALALGLTSPTSLALVTGIGVLGALVVRLVGWSSESGALIALLGTVILAAGIAMDAHLPAVLAGVVIGVLIVRASASAAMVRVGERSERPVRIALTVIIASSITFDMQALVLGLLLAGMDVCATALALGWRVAFRSRYFGASSLALALCSSFAAAGVMPELLPTLVIAIAAIETVSLVSHVVGRRSTDDAPAAVPT